MHTLTINSDISSVIARRKFLRGLAGVVAGSFATLVGLPAIAHAPANEAPAEPAGKWLALGAASLLIPGVPTGFPFSRKVKDGWIESVETGVAYAVKDDGANVTVFSNVCPHEGCRVHWSEEQSNFLCPCHHGSFGINGAVNTGPASRPLDRFKARIQGGQIEILVEA